MMQLLDIRALCAPNVWSDVPVIECRVVCDPISDQRIEKILEQLNPVSSLISILEHRRFDSPAHALVELSLTLQRNAGCSVAFGQVRPTPFAHIWHLAFAAEEEPIGRTALEVASRLLAADENLDPDFVEKQSALVGHAVDQYRAGGTTRALVAAARKRSIPVIRLDGESLIQLGQGVKQHRLRMAMTDRTGYIAEWIARDKLLTKQLLRQAGIPVADGRRVSDAEDACRAAREIGTAVVVKPCDSDFGNGVSVDLIDPSMIRSAYEHARSFSGNVMVERYLPGYWHRLLVVDGKLVAAVRREPPSVTGDGQLTIRSLIEDYNSDPRRGFGERFAYDPLIVGATVLSVLYRQGYSLDSVPGPGVEVRLRQDAYLCRGGSQSDVTDRVHPQIAEAAVSAAELIGLDVAGIDLLCDDVSGPIDRACCGVLEVNAEPALVVHMAPVCDPPRPVAERIIESLFPSAEDGRIPVIVVIGQAEFAQRLAEHLISSGQLTGFISRNETQIHGRAIGDESPAISARAKALLLQRRLQAVVILLTLGDILEEGMPLDRCDLLCLQSLSEWNDHENEHRHNDDRRVMDLLFSPFAREVVVNQDGAGVREHLPCQSLQAVLVGEDDARFESPHDATSGELEVPYRAHNQPIEPDNRCPNVSLRAECEFESICHKRIDQLLSTLPSIHKSDA